MKIVTIVGARPQFIKAGPVSKAIAAHNDRADSPRGTIEEVIIHTGQHYDHEMSGVFFESLGLTAPKYNLGVGSGSHGFQLAKMIEGLEVALRYEAPDLVMVYGDTNTTLAGALMADRLSIPVAHVEAGLRSFNRRMAEECNRIVADRLSTLLFAPTTAAVQNLEREGIHEGVFLVGDVMYEAAMSHSQTAEIESKILEKLCLTRGEYALATIHRAENTDDPLRMRGIVEGLRDASRSHKIVWPVHPRTRKQMSSWAAADRPAGLLLLTDPLPYYDMLVLEKSASVVLTDSGGVQKEAMWFGVPCVTLREETEWVETVAAGRNELAGCSREKIGVAFKAALLKGRAAIPAEGNGTPASALIVQHLCAFKGRNLKFAASGA